MTTAVENRKHVLWKAAEDNTVRDLWGQGISVALIAAHLTRRSRNSVIGRVHRLKLTSRKTTARAPPRPYQRSPKPQPSPIPLQEREAMPDQPPSFAPLWKPFLKLRAAECRWPKDIENLKLRAERFCALPVVEGKSYCTDHYQRAFRCAPEPTSRPFVLETYRRAA